MCLPEGFAEAFGVIEQIDDLDHLAELFAAASRQWMRQLTWTRMQAIRVNRGLERQPFPAG